MSIMTASDELDVNNPDDLAFALGYPTQSERMLGQPMINEHMMGSSNMAKDIFGQPTAMEQPLNHLIESELAIAKDSENQKAKNVVNFDRPGNGIQDALYAAKMELVLAHLKDAKPATRPVNSFMTFRTYYSIMFGKAHQKEISGVLTFLWKNDPAQNKWAILAKAYSIIRDAQGKLASPVEIFLSINAPFIKVPHPSEYLRAMGWAISGGNDFCIVRQNAIDKSFLETRHSVHDIIQHSIEAGFVLVKGLSQLNFDLMMVRSHGESQTRRAMPETLNYKPTGRDAFFEDFNAAKTTGTDFDPFIGDPFDIYNVSEIFNSWA